MTRKYTKAKGDCDDTMIVKLETGVDENYPRDLMDGNFYLVPPSDMTGVKDVELGGHAVAVFQRLGHLPMSMEQIGMSRDLRYVEEELGYYCVGFKPMTEDWRGDWLFVDREGYELLEQGIISVDEAKQRDEYIRHTDWTNTPYEHGNKSRPTDGKTFSYFAERVNEMHQKDSVKFDRYFSGAKVVRLNNSVNFLERVEENNPINGNSYDITELSDRNKTLKYRFSISSLSKLVGVDSRLVDVFLEVANMIDIKIVYGIRSQEEQHDLYLQGRSSKDGYKNKSMHQTFKALDVVPVKKGLNMYTPTKENTLRWAFFVGVVMAVAKNQGVNIRNGWKWRKTVMDTLLRPISENTLVDSNHFEIRD